MKFSIIVPIYKVEEYLEKCVKSLVNQTEKDIEIILVDDGSPDKCPMMCDEFAKTDCRIKVIHKKNGGLSDARNAGLDVATGEYIMFVDSDDQIENDACERFYNIIIQNKGVDIVASYLVDDGKIAIAKNAPNSPLNGKDYLKFALKNNIFRIEACFSIFRRKFLEENSLRFKVGFLHEDTEFTPRTYVLAKSVINSKMGFYHYTINPNSIMHKKDFRRNCQCIYEIITEHEKNFKSLEDKKLYKYLMDFLLIQYFSVFNMGYCSKYGQEYIHKKFAIKHAYRLRTRLHTLVFVFSAKLYNYLINKEGRQNGAKNS